MSDNIKLLARTFSQKKKRHEINIDLNLELADGVDELNMFLYQQIQDLH